MVSFKKDGVYVGGKKIIGTRKGVVAAPATATQAALTLTSMTGTANTAPAAETNLAALTDSSGGVAAATLPSITAGAEYAQADMAAVKVAVATIAAELAKQRSLNTVLVNDAKIFATQLNAAKTDLAARDTTINALRTRLSAHGLVDAV